MNEILGSEIEVGATWKPNNGLTGNSFSIVDRDLISGPDSTSSDHLTPADFIPITSHPLISFRVLELQPPLIEGPALFNHMSNPKVDNSHPGHLPQLFLDYFRVGFAGVVEIAK